MPVSTAIGTAVEHPYDNPPGTKEANDAVSEMTYLSFFRFMVWILS